MIYIVSGIHRSGTSVMMKALIESGITPIWKKAREKEQRLNNTLDYLVNPDGFWEVGYQEYMRLGFTSELPQESCVKIQAKGLPLISPGKGYKIIYMRRDPEAIRQSYYRAYNQDSFDREYPDWPTYYWTLLDGVRGIMQQRRDVELLEVHFDEMIDAPEKVFTQIKAMGVPVAIEPCVQLIKPEYRRYG